MKISIKNFLSKCDQIRSLQRIWSHLLKKSLMENFIFCTVQYEKFSTGRFTSQTVFHNHSWKIKIIPENLNNNS